MSLRAMKGAVRRFAWLLVCCGLGAAPVPDESRFPSDRLDEENGLEFARFGSKIQDGNGLRKIYRSKDGRYAVFRSDAERTVYGLAAERTIYFTFDGRLRRVEVLFQEGVPQERVAAVLKERYGEPAQQSTTNYSTRPAQNSTVSLMWKGERVRLWLGLASQSFVQIESTALMHAFVHWREVAPPDREWGVFQ